MKLIMRHNGFCKGVELKREPTEEEILYCLNKILGFDVDWALSEFDDEEELEQEKDDIRETFIKFIKGDCVWYTLCDVLYNYDDTDYYTIGNFAHLLTWLEEKEII